MAWALWPRRSSVRACVGGVDLQGEGLHVVVLTGSTRAADGVCCAETLTPPLGCVVAGQLLQPHTLGVWFKEWLNARDLRIEALSVAVDALEVERGTLRLPAELLPDDVDFQIAAELQAGPDEEALSWDYVNKAQGNGNSNSNGNASLSDSSPPHDDRHSPGRDQPVFASATAMFPSSDAALGAKPTDPLTYNWATVPRVRVDAWQQWAMAAGLRLLSVTPRSDAQALTQRSELTAQLLPAHLGLALHHDVALGLALRAWRSDGFNFLPHRALQQQRLRRQWWQRMAVGGLVGALWGWGGSVWLSQMAAQLRTETGDLTAAEQALKQGRTAEKDAQIDLANAQALHQWLQDQTLLQQHTLPWSRVLAQHSQGLWVSEVKQQQAHWVVKGEALSAAQAQHLTQQLKGLTIWAKAPELLHLALSGAPTSPIGLPVWQFRIEAALKAGS